MAELRLSVIVPVRNGAEVLGRSLAALGASDLARSAWELIVVDDGSTDGTDGVAGEHADRVVRLDCGPRGPAYARNRGAEAARGEHLAFVDADVCVHAHTLRGLVERLDADAGLGAVFGAYDTEPPARGLVSQYRNLVHHWVHARHAGEAHTFWAGCGAVRAEAFGEVGGFDAARYPRPQIEDIELGHRLCEAGWRIVLDPSLQGTHLKRWTLRGGLVTDVRDRGVPWARLLLDGGGGGVRGSALNLHPVEKLATAFVGLGLAAAALAVVRADGGWLVAAAILLVLALLPSLPLFRWLARVRGPAFAMCAVPLRLLYYVANGVSVIVAGWQRLRSDGPIAPRSDAPQLRT